MLLIRHRAVTKRAVPLAVIAALAAGCGADTGPTTTAASGAPPQGASSSAASTQPRPTVTPSVPTRSDIGSRQLAAVPVGASVAMNGGLRVRVTDVRDVQIEARGPGEISGPGVAVDVEVKNTSGDPIDVNGSAVNAAYGDIPASPSSSEPSSPLMGRLAPGKATMGVYVFLTPPGAKGKLRVQFEHNASSDVVEVRQ
jgi:hypothetical protein